LVLVIGGTVAFAAPATIGDAQADFSAGQYPACLQKISQILAGPTAKPGSPQRYDLFMLRGECLMQMRRGDLAASAFESAALACKDSGPMTSFATAQATAILIKASPGLRYKPKLNPSSDPNGIDIVPAEGRKAAMLALLDDRIAELKPKVDQALAGTTLPPMIDLVPAVSDMYMVEMAATGKTERMSDMGKAMGQHARDLIQPALQQITSRLQQLQDLANEPSEQNRQFGYRGLTSPERQELQDQADYLMKIEKLAQNARQLSRRLGGNVEAWDAILADCEEAKQAAEAAYNRRY
jgi:hypothetical protein